MDKKTISEEHLSFVGVGAEHSDTHTAAKFRRDVGPETTYYTEEEERRVRRKLDARIPPMVFFLYMLAFLDRSNIGNAKTAGMNLDLGIDSGQYQWLLTIYYISYIVFQTMLLAWKVLSPRILSSCMVFAWGTTSMLQATAYNWEGLMTARFFIGVFEASFAPGVALYMSSFYPRFEFGLRFGLFASAAALASSFAGALAYGIVHATGSHIATWRLLFIVEGAPTVLVAPFVYFILPNSIDECSFLTPREKEVARLRMRGSNDLSEDYVAELRYKGMLNTVKGLLDWNQVGAAFKEPTNYLSAALFFIANVTFASLPVYLPTILNEAGFSSVRAQGLSAPPYLLAFLFALATCFLSDRARHRGLFVACVSAMGASGYMILALCEGPWVRYGALYLVATGCFTMVPVLYSWISNNHENDTKRGAGFVLFGLIGQCGPLLGVRLYPAQEGPYYVRGMSIGAGLLFLAVVLSLALSAYFKLMNKRMDLRQGDEGAGNSDPNLAGGTAGEELARFRYVT